MAQETNQEVTLDNYDKDKFKIDGNVLAKYLFKSAKRTHVAIPNGINEIGVCAFLGSEDIVSVSIPNSVTSIFDSAFADCSSLKTIEYGGSTEEWEKIEIDTAADLVGVPMHCLDGIING